MNACTGNQVDPLTRCQVASAGGSPGQVEHSCSCRVVVENGIVEIDRVASEIPAVAVQRVAVKEQKTLVVKGSAILGERSCLLGSWAIERHPEGPC